MRIKQLILLGLIVVLLAMVIIFAYMIYNRMKAPVQPTETTPISESEKKTEESELSFSLNENSTTTKSDKPTIACLDLAAEPSSGTPPVTVTFTGIAQNNTPNSLFFVFNTGRANTTKSIESKPTADGIQFESYVYTYNQPGNYTATLTIKSEDQEYTSQDCEVSLAIGSSTTAKTTVNPTNAVGGPTTTTPAKLAQAGTVTPTIVRTTPTKIPSSKLSPTTKINKTPTPVNNVPLPDVPKAGGLLPTLVAGLGGLAVVLLAIGL
jgi:PKD repeat protein